MILTLRKICLNEVFQQVVSILKNLMAVIVLKRK